ncbi:hypothetical protein HK101_000727 [Irineochytrium annulatum]|nr:hypothetical protein HK101_000727 [Irineochytrium annulatum]
MVALQLTSRIRKAAAEALDGAPTGLKNRLKSFAEDGSDDDGVRSIPHGLVKELAAHLAEKNNATSEQTFASLVSGSRIVISPPPPIVKSPELLRILEKCRAKLESKDYAEMVKGVAPRSFYENQDGDGGESELTWRQATAVLSAVSNVILSMVAVFVAFFYFGGSFSNDVGTRTLFSLAAALVVGFAEGWFFTRDLVSGESTFQKIRHR